MTDLQNVFNLLLLEAGLDNQNLNIFWQLHSSMAIKMAVFITETKQTHALHCIVVDHDPWSLSSVTYLI